MFDDPEMPSDVMNTIWIEENVKKLHRERDEYRAKWETLRQWLSKRRDASDWTTVGMIERYMEELDKTPPIWQPTFVPEGLVIGEETEMK